MTLDSQNCTVWPIDTTVGCWDIPDTTPQHTIDMWTRVASDYLWAMTGRRLGPSCPISVRPCRKSCADNYGIFNRLYQGQGSLSTGPFTPFMRDGQMYNAVLCGCSGDCHCGAELCEIELPGPVYDIVEVTVDGLVVPSETYRVDDAKYLTRLNTGVAGDAARCWPTCQDMTLRESQPNTFQITYRTGLNLSGIATMAVTELTAHFIRGCNGGCGCGTGTMQNLQRMSRQGVDLEFADPQQLFTDGRTGIEVVDMFIRSMNPYALPGPLRVLSPDAPRRPRITGTVV